MRNTGSGSWSYAADTSWTVESTDHAPSLSIFCKPAEAEDLAHLTGVLGAVIDSGQVATVQPGEADPDWSTWSSGEVIFLLYVGEQHRVNKHLVPALLILRIERADAPHHPLVPDSQRARRLARDGSAIVRWYLAGEDHLPDDVVALLAADEDAAVVAALNVNEAQRRLARGGH